jgi:hypothetical protein
MTKGEFSSFVNTLLELKLSLNTTAHSKIELHVDSKTHRFLETHAQRKMSEGYGITSYPNELQIVGIKIKEIKE